jgi:hypothetical protein
MPKQVSLVFFASVLCAACYESASRGGPDAIQDSFNDLASDLVPDTPDQLYEPIWDLGDDSDMWDIDTFEFDGYSPPACRLFAVDLEWEVSVEEPYVSTSFFESSDEPMLSVISLYEPSSCPHHARCPVTLHISRTYRPVVLVLSSYEAVEWVIDRAEGARIERILVGGYYESTVSGAGDVPTDLDSISYFGYCWPRCSDHDTENEIRGIEGMLGIPLGSFFGAYRAGELTLWHICREDCLEEVACAGRECGMNECGYECGSCPDSHVCVDFRCVPCTSDCTGRECGPDGCDGSCGSCREDFICHEGWCIEAPYYAGCEEVASESHYCLTLGDAGASLMGLDTGLVCPLGKGNEALSLGWPEAHSIALLDGHVHLCVDGAIGGIGVHGILRVSLLSGLWEVIPVLCYSLARYQEGLLVQPDMSFGPFGVVYYPSIEHLRSGDGEPIPGSITALRMTVNGNTLYSAWFSTDQVDTFQLPSGSSLGTIYLEDYDTWIQGMSVTDDGLLICNASWPEGRVAVFDAETGAHLRDVHPVTEDGSSTTVMGLVCMTNP